MIPIDIIHFNTDFLIQISLSVANPPKPGLYVKKNRVMAPKFKVLDIKKILKDRIGLYSYNIVDPTVDFSKSYANYHMLLILIPFFLMSSSTFIYGHLSEFSLLLKSGALQFN